MNKHPQLLNTVVKASLNAQLPHQQSTSLKTQVYYHPTQARRYLEDGGFILEVIQNHGGHELLARPLHN